MKKTLLGCGLGILIVAVSVYASSARQAKAMYSEALRETAAVPAHFDRILDQVMDPHSNRAEDLFRKLLVNDPKNPAYHAEYARLLCKIDKPNECRAEVMIALQLEPRNAAAQVMLTRLEDARREQDLLRQAAIQRETNEHAAMLQRETNEAFVEEQARLQRANGEVLAQQQADLQRDTNAVFAQDLAIEQRDAQARERNRLEADARYRRMVGSIWDKK